MSDLQEDNFKKLAYLARVGTLKLSDENARAIVWAELEINIMREVLKKLKIDSVSVGCCNYRVSSSGRLIQE